MSYAASFPDVDGDGDVDFYANHHWASPGILYRNDGSPPWPVGQPFPVPRDRHDLIWGDLNDDGSPDTYITHGGDQTKELWWNRGPGALQEGAAAAGVQDLAGRGREVTLFDADNDGWLDIFAVNDNRTGFVKPSVLFYNQGDETFIRYPNTQEVFFARLHVAAADYDLDGDVDIVTTNPPYAAGELYRNDGNFIWNNITSTAFAGISNPLMQATGLSWEDFDNDGDLDLLGCGGNRGLWDYAALEGDSVRYYVECTTTDQKTAWLVTDGDSVTVWTQNSEYQPVCCYFGAAGESTFTYPAKFAIADIAGTPPQLGAGIRRGIFLASFDVAAGDSVALTAYRPGTAAFLLVGGAMRTNGAILSNGKKGYEARPGYSLGDFTNRLFRNEGNGTFAEVTATAFDVNPSNICSLGAAWGDYDNDGWIDVYIVNSGNVETGNEPNWLFKNDGDGTFTEVAAAEGVSGSERGLSDGACWADVNADGFLDLYVEHGAEHPPFGIGPRELFLTTPNSNHWLQLQLRGIASNGSGIGARVRFVSAGGVRWRYRLGESNNGFSDQTTLHVGLGADAVVDSVQIFWPSGTVDLYTAVAADQSLWAVEGSGLRSYANPQFAVEEDSLTATVFINFEHVWSVTADNPGGLPSAYSARTEACDGSPAPWLFVKPASGAVWPGGAPFRVIADGALLTVGEHCGRVIFESPNAAEPETVFVNVTAQSDPTGSPEIAGLPRGFALGPPRPNPVRGSAEMVLEMPRAERVNVEVVAVDGRRVATVANGTLEAGRHVLRWNGRDGSGARAAPGVYMIRATSPSGRSTRKLTLLD